MTDAPAPALTLAAVAERIEPPVPTTRAAGYADRLAVLADWWTTVSPHPAPRSVAVLWAAEPPPVATPEAAVMLVPFDVAAFAEAAAVEPGAVGDPTAATRTAGAGLTPPEPTAEATGPAAPEPGADASPTPPEPTADASPTAPEPTADAGANITEPAADAGTAGAESAVARAIAAGVAAADRAVDGSADLVLLSVPADRGAAAALAAHLLGLDAVEAQGWPRAEGLTDDEWMIRVEDLRDDLRRMHGAHDADEIAARLGDPALAAAAAVVLQCAARRTPLLVEGLAGAVAGLLAQRAGRTARQWWLPADGPVDGAPAAGLHDRVLTHLRHEPLLRLGLAHADATGARLGLTLLEAALA